MAALTTEMVHSGETLDWSDFPGRKVDKHSTGGVGDKTSLILGRSLRPRGCTSDDIRARSGTHRWHARQAGIDPRVPSAPLDQGVPRGPRCHRLAFAGQTAEIAPADRKLYALRDVTATVESVPLITSSILSKKLAEGIDALVLDVKVGSGAFMKKQSDALTLARTLVQTGTRAGKKSWR